MPDWMAECITLAQHRWVRALLGNLWHGAWVAFTVFCLIYLLERLTGERTTQYTTRNFRNDLVFWFYYHSGVHDFFLALLIFAFLEQQVAFLRLPLDGLPLVGRYILYWVIFDFIGYWCHRMLHTNRYLWALHLMHHSQEILTFPTGIRVHPLENVFVFCVKFLPLAMIGVQPTIWLSVDFVLRMVPDAFQHTEIAWRMGPLYRILVSPSFHSFHHSVKPEHHNKNFGISLSLWDFLFGTGIDEPERARVYGIQGVSWPTVRSQLTEPLRMIHGMLRDSKGSPQPIAQTRKT
ncbi:MAG: sterol desaturase family protein [Candidatus Tectimicrobiota bacterium]